MYRTLLIFVMLFAALCSNGMAHGSDPLNATLYNSSGGLSSNRINDILQDSRGYLWIATRDGLNRFDGYDFLVFRPNIYDSLSIISENILAIEESPSGNIWVATSKGVSQYLRNKGRFTNISFYPRFISASNNETHDLVFTSDSSLYCLLKNRLIEYFPATNRFIEIEIPNEAISGRSIGDGKMYYDKSNGVLFIATDIGLFMHHVGTQEVVRNEYTSDKRIFDIYPGKNGVIFLGTRDGLIACHISDLSGLPDKNELIYSGKAIRGITGDREGRLLLATRNGVMKFDIISRRVIQNDFVQVSGYERIPTVRKVLTDGSKNLWIGTVDGICKTDLKPKKISVYNKESTGFQLDNEMISSILEKDSVLYLGSWGGGLQVLKLKENENTYYQIGDTDHFYPERSIGFIYRDKHEQIWTGFSSIYIFDEISNSFRTIDQVYDIPELEQIKPSLVFDILELDDHQMVFARRDGLLFLNDSTGECYLDSIVKVDSISVPLVDVTSIEKNHDNMWLACRTGLIYYNIEGNDHQYYPFHSSDGLSDRILTMKIDSEHRLWVGTPTGLFRFDKKKGSFEGYSVTIGLANDYIYAIEEDDEGLLWLSTNKGIISLDPRTEEIRNYGVQHGLSCMEFNLHASYYSETGLLYFGGINGVNFFDPDSVNKPVSLPSTEITGMQCYKKDRQEYRPYASNHFVMSDDESIQLFFSLLDHGDPDYKEFKYRLSHGRDRGVWRYIGNENSLILSGLTHGAYSFEVVGANIDGIWSTSPATLSLEVIAPFYRRPVFTLVMLLPALLLVYFLFEYRTKTLRKSNHALREKEIAAKQVLKQKNLLMRRNKNIEDSLKYAQRIQNAMFTSEIEIKKMLPESFILQKPKDIVSGDFYWGRQLDNKIFLAAADCTGHGVPGAFMSLIGLEFFRQIILSKGIHKPSQILDEINISFDGIFDNMDDIELRDGMDLAFIAYDKETKILQYAGAFNPLYIVRDGEIIEIKGDRNILGPDLGFGRESFQNHEIEIEDQDVLYIFSDGYADQFGGPEGKKFKYRRFRHLLLSIYDKPLSMQQSILDNSIVDWIGPYEQVDDILVVGFRPQSAH